MASPVAAVEAAALGSMFETALPMDSSSANSLSTAAAADSGSPFELEDAANCVPNRKPVCLGMARVMQWSCPARP